MGMSMVLLVGVPVIVLLALSTWLAPKRRDPRLDRDWAGVRLPALHDIDDDRPQF